MRLQKIKLFSGMSLSVLLSLAAVFPAIAHHTPEHGKGQAIAQMSDTDQNVTGRIKSIVGNVVTVELTDGTTRDIMISRAERERLALRPGMEIATTIRNGNLIVEVVNANGASQASSSAASSMNTTTNSEASNSSAASSMNTTTNSEASNSEASTSTTTGRRVVEESTIIRRSTTSAPVVEQSTEQTTGDVQQSAQEVEQNTDTTVTEERSQPARPVRALW